MFVPISPLTLLSLVAYVGLKSRGEQGGGLGAYALEFAGHILGHIGGEPAAKDAERLRERLAEWLKGPHPDSNLDLEQAVTRSAIHADLFCVMEALAEPADPPQGRLERWRKVLWERCPETIKDSCGVQVLFDADAKPVLRAARSYCEGRLK